jgi:hypothetical protein
MFFTTVMSEKYAYKYYFVMVYLRTPSATQIKMASNYGLLENNRSEKICEEDVVLIF